MASETGEFVYEIWENTEEKKTTRAVYHAHPMCQILCEALAVSHLILSTTFSGRNTITPILQERRLKPSPHTSQFIRGRAQREEKAGGRKSTGCRS